jgi:hypothetical protein
MRKNPTYSILVSAKITCYFYVYINCSFMLIRSVLIFLVLTHFQTLCSYSQSISSPVSTNFYMETYNIRGKPFVNPEATNVEGSPLLNTEWGTGTVYFKDGAIAKGVELKFNLEKNELYFNRDGALFLFNDPITSFRMNFSYVGKQYDVLFRSGYPATEKLGASTFYQVLEDGAKFQLLNYRFSYLADSYRYGGTAKKAFIEGEELYVYDVAFSKLIKIKRGEQGILDAMPSELSSKILSIAKSKRSKLKSNQDLIALIEELNK